jgi:Protein of unknown function (DUF2029).
MSSEGRLLSTDFRTISVSHWNAPLKYVIAVTGIIVCFSLCAAVIERYAAFGWQGDDFVEFYAAGRLAGSGNLYNLEALRGVEAQHRLGIFSAPFLRMPFYAWALKPLASLDYRVARGIWFLLGVLAAGVVVAIWPTGSFADRLVAASWFLPVAYTIVSGQDVLLFLLFAALGARYLENRPSLAGLMFACCAFKYNLTIGLGVFLLGSRRWRVVAWTALGVAAEIILSFLLEGWSWPAEYLSLLGAPGSDLGAGGMPNLRGVFSRLPATTILELACGLLVVWIFWRASWRIDVTTGMALALGLGLLIGHHSYLYDISLALPLVMDAMAHVRSRVYVFILLTPPLYLLPWLFGLREYWFVMSQTIVVGTIVLMAARTLACTTHRER